MMDGQWSKERIWRWYDERPWIRGCNFLGSDVVNSVEMWQEYGFEEKMKTAEREIKLLAETGYNAVRIGLSYQIWKEDHDGFMSRLDRYIDTLDRYGVKIMPILGNDCQVPKDNPYAHLKQGPQHFDIGYHGGREKSQHSTLNTAPGYWAIDDEPDEVYKFVREIITAYKDDERILVWDLYNEPGNSDREGITVPHLKRFYEIAREVAPIQPLTSGAWRMSWVNDGLAAEDKMAATDRYILENSDIISYHNYHPYIENVRVLRYLKSYGRPILNTEWLARVLHNTVQEMFPLFYEEKIGSFNWGFVAGKYQGYEPWEIVWETCGPGGRHADADFTKWFHDLYRPSLRPYDPKEIEIIKTLSAAADEEFLARRK